MFSLIECRLRPSRLAWLVVLVPAPTVALLTVLAQHPWWLSLATAAAVQLALWQSRPLNPPAHQLRWQGARVTLFDRERRAEEYRWSGRGRRSACYVRLHLVQEPLLLQRSLMIWRDSVDDASWRALNAYFRIHCHDIQSQHQLD